MNQIYILCIDDEADVLEAVERDLATLETVFPLETAASAGEARELLERIEAQGDQIGVVFCDHVMPEETGGEFLSWMEMTPYWKTTRKALLTGQAGLEATVSAINNAGLDFYVSKPWTRVDLIKAAQRLLTDYVIERDLNPLPYMATLDAERLSDHAYHKGLLSDT